MMTNKLRALLATLGVVVAGGGAYWLQTPLRSVSTSALIDAGIADGQPFVLTCPERLSPKLRNRLLDAGSIRPNQRHARVSRVAVCFRPDGGSGNCFNVSGGSILASRGGSIIVPSLRKLNGGSAIDDDADDSEPLAEDCTAQRCNEFDAGTCLQPMRVWAAVPSHVIPDCRSAGTWNDKHAPVDCRRLLPDGGTRWNGCNAMPRNLAVGTQCLNAPGNVYQGDNWVDGMGL